MPIEIKRMGRFLWAHPVGQKFTSIAFTVLSVMIVTTALHFQSRHVIQHEVNEQVNHIIDVRFNALYLERSKWVEERNSIISAIVDRTAGRYDIDMAKEAWEHFLMTGTMPPFDEIQGKALEGRNLHEEFLRSSTPQPWPDPHHPEGVKGD